MKAAIYARTASNEQSTADQIQLCREYIVEQGGVITGIYDDPGVSAHQFPRDGLSLLMNDAINNEFDAVVLTSFDRLFRDNGQMDDFLCGLGQLGISLTAVKSL